MPASVIAQRSWTRSAVLAIADEEARGLGTDIEKATIAFDFQNSAWAFYAKRYASRWGAYRQDWLDQERVLQGKQYWAVFYGPLYQAPAIGMFIFIDRETGDVVGHFTPRVPPQTTE